MFGEVKLVLFDDRKESSTINKYQKFFITEKLLTNNYTTKCLEWFKGIGKNESYIANCLTLPHNEKRWLKRP